MRSGRALLAGAAYFAIVFVAGSCLGVIRMLWVTPHLGPTLAVAIETPLMLAVSLAGLPMGVGALFAGRRRRATV